jgi:aspartyl-tRNA(Asn)/glutamyl-tRNA(Gln) amidotransferase subunit A
MDEGVDEGVRKCIEEQIEILKIAGHTVKTVSLPLVKAALAVYYIVAPAEISSNLARYDGIKYGHRSPAAASIKETYVMSRMEGFNNENKRRVMIGNYVLSSGYYDAYYRKAQTVRTLLIDEFRRAFDDFDVLLGPVAPQPAFKIGENISDPLTMYLVDIMTVSVSLVGVPALSVPAGKANGLPVGMQLIGSMNQDKMILGLAHEIEGLQL